MKCNGANPSNHSKQTAFKTTCDRDTLENARPLVKLEKHCEIGANCSQNSVRMPCFALGKQNMGMFCATQTRHNSPKRQKETANCCILAKKMQHHGKTLIFPKIPIQKQQVQPSACSKHTIIYYIFVIPYNNTILAWPIITKTTII